MASWPVESILSNICVSVRVSVCLPLQKYDAYEFAASNVLTFIIFTDPLNCRTPESCSDGGNGNFGQAAMEEGELSKLSK